MKRHISSLLFLSCISSSLLCGSVVEETPSLPQTQSVSTLTETQQNQTSEPFTFKYAEMQQKKDEFKHEIYLKNPVFTHSDASAERMRLSLDGTLKIVLSLKGNRAEMTLDGVIHLFLAEETMDQPADMTIDGKWIGSLDGDLLKLKKSLFESKLNELSEQDLIALLESLKVVSASGNNLKIVNKLLPEGANNLVFLDTLNVGYRQTTTATPEEFTLSFKGKHGASFVGYGGIFGFPDEKGIHFEGDAKLLLQEWKKLAAFLKNERWQSLPEGLLEMRMTGKSVFSEQSWKTLFASKQEDSSHKKIESKLHFDSKVAADWIEQVQKLKREKLDKAFKSQNFLKNFVEDSVYQWLISPKTTTFLKLLPLQLTLDWDAALTYSDMEQSYIKVGTLDASLMGAGRSGLKINSTYEKDDFKSVVTLLGGRATFDYAITLYNSFADSLEAHWKLPRVSPKFAENLYKLLAKYSDDPAKSKDELKILFGRTKEGDATVGNEKFSQFQVDLLSVLKKWNESL